METEESPKDPQLLPTPSHRGLWAALVRTLDRSGDDDFSPTDEDLELFDAVLCRPYAAKFASSNPDSFEELLQEARLSLMAAYPKAVMHPKLSKAPAENRDREASNYLKACLRNSLLLVVEKDLLKKEMRSRVRTALRNELFTLGDHGNRLAERLSFRRAGLDDLLKLIDRAGFRTPTGFCRAVGSNLPTVNEIVGLTQWAMNESEMGFSEDQVLEMTHHVFSIPQSMRDVSLDEPVDEDTYRPAHTPKDPSLEESPDTPIGKTSRVIAQEVEVAKRVILETVRKLDAGARGEGGTPCEDAFFDFLLCNGYPIGSKERVSGVLYQRKTGTPDATTKERLDKLTMALKKNRTLQNLGEDVVLAALADFQENNFERFRKFWGVPSSSEQMT